MINQLVRLLSKIPGLGPKSAQRIAFHLLKNKELLLRPLAVSFKNVLNRIIPCSKCGYWAESNLCFICQDPNRNQSLLCIVEDMVDVLSIEKSGCYKGLYHILGGVLSAIDGVTPKDLNLDHLQDRINHHTEEIILALNSSIESKNTFYYILNILKDTNIKITGLAQGIPSGSHIENLDEETLSHAVNDRRVIHQSK